MLAVQHGSHNHLHALQHAQPQTLFHYFLSRGLDDGSRVGFHLLEGAIGRAVLEWLHGLPDAHDRVGSQGDHVWERVHERPGDLVVVSRTGVTAGLEWCEAVG